MDPASPDSTLIGTYAREGSEDAFRILVARHVNLVFAAALRQVFDRGVAEEITQEVFVILARKAPRLAGHETLAGWLHRTAVLAARARIRAELRRQRREVKSAIPESTAGDSSAFVDELTPLLDEALLGLRETDRTAVILRYFEERSLRDIGATLGVDEDAARKRVTRALARLGEFFKSRGIRIPAGGGAALFANSLHGAPVLLQASASAAGIAAGKPATGFGLLLLQMMTLNKTQLAAFGVILMTCSLAWQHSALAKARFELQEQWAASPTFQDTSTGGTPAAPNISGAGASALRPSGHRWDDQSPYARIPKELLAQIPASGVSGRRGVLTSEIRSLLRLDPVETRGVQGAIDRFLSEYQALLRESAHRVEPTTDELQRRPKEDVRTWEVTGLQQKFGPLRDTLLQDLDGLLGTDRARLLFQSLRTWMPITGGTPEPGFENRIFANDFRYSVAYEPPQYGDGSLRFEGAHSDTNGFNSSEKLPPSELPDFVQAEIQDWLQRAAKEPTAKPSKP